MIEVGELVYLSCFCLDTFQMTSGFNNIHTQIWKGLTALEHDIFPDVSSTAQKLTKYIRQKVGNVCVQLLFLLYLKMLLF